MAHREVFESIEFTAQLERLGDIKRLDERLRGLTIALWVDAEIFPLVAETHRLRIATVESYSNDPALTIWFEIDGDQVILRWIEPTPADR